MEKRNGGCHCGKVRYEAEVDLATPVVECNCSICAGKGLLLTFTPESQMTITSGGELLTEYRFNTEKLVHFFCKMCGMEVFVKAHDPSGNVVYAINARTLDGVDVSALERTPRDGKAG
ncbi:MAG: GFA family protein [Patescibacteria group bacterium]